MTKPDSVLFRDLLVATKDGDWGKGADCDGHVPAHVIRGTDFASVERGEIAAVPLRFLSEKTIHRRLLKADDILIETAGGSRDKPTGRTALITQRVLDSFPGDVTCASFARFLRIDPKVANPHYIYWYLQHLYARGDMWTHQVQHTGVARFQFTRFADTELVPLPTRIQQDGIAAVLGALDDKIAVNKGIAATARELGLTLFAQSVQRGEAAEVEVQAIASALTRGVAPKYSDSPDELMVLNQKCIRGGRVDLEPARLTLREKVMPTKLLLRHDVLVNSTGVGTLGRVARWTSKTDATVDSHITVVRFDERRVDPVCAGFAMLRAQPEIESMGEGSTGQTELRRAQVGALEILLPDLTRQRELRATLDPLEERADQALAESRTVTTLRDTLLPELMSGRLRVKDAERIIEDHA